MKKAASTNAGPNELCVCGSGRKAKMCCAAGGSDSGVAVATLPVPEQAAAQEAAPHEADVAPLVLGSTFVLAFCSIVYELLLGQTLSAFLGNTVLRYSVTIGLYMLSMGVGALLVGRRALARPVRTLQTVELALTVLGGTSVVALFWADGFGVPALAVGVIAHALIVTVGVLSGMEIPLLIEARCGPDGSRAGEVLGVDYAGAFVGTVAFATYFYPKLGLVPTAFFVASLNAAVGAALVFLPGGSASRRLAVVQALLLVALLVALGFAGDVSEAGLALYLRG